MTLYSSMGQVWCHICDIIYTDGIKIHTFPYVLYQGKRYTIDIWERMLELKAFW
jgi:hypothetical protein